MADTFYIKDHDTFPIIQTVLRDGMNQPVGLGPSDVVTFRFQPLSCLFPVTEFPAMVVAPDAPVGDPNRGAVSCSIPFDAYIPPGRYNVEWLVEFAMGAESTFPNRGYNVLEVGKRLAVCDPVGSPAAVLMGGLTPMLLRG